MPIEDDARSMACRALQASRVIAAAGPDARQHSIESMATRIDGASDDILAANELDVAAAAEGGASMAILDRLRLDPQRISDIASAVRVIAGLDDPVGSELDRLDRADGLVIRRVRVPLGVVLMIYESRPNVTADAAALCLRAGNAVMLKGGREAQRSNVAIHRALQAALVSADLPADAVQLVPGADRAYVAALLERDREIDLVVPRGGPELIRAVTGSARMPVLKHDAGVCHVYVDAAADPAMAVDIIENAKCQRPGVCNAAETLLVHAAVADDILPLVAQRLGARGVRFRADNAARALIPGAEAATNADWSAEYLDLILAVRVVADLDAAIEHIGRWGTRHSEVVVTADKCVAGRFQREIDAAVVYHNASSRFTDGAEFGLGAEIGISTSKLHARGPCGVNALTTSKYLVDGAGQVRTG